jgi:hypothetical protein
MISLIKSKLTPLLKSPDFLIFDKSQRSRTMVLFALIFVSLACILLLHVNYMRLFKNVPPHVSILFCIGSFLGTYWWLRKKLQEDLFRLVFCKISFIQFKYEIYALLIFIRYILVIVFFGFLLMVAVCGTVYLLVR